LVCTPYRMRKSPAVFLITTRCNRIWDEPIDGEIITLKAGQFGGLQIVFYGQDPSWPLDRAQKQKQTASGGLGLGRTEAHRRHTGWVLHCSLMAAAKGRAEKEKFPLLKFKRRRRRGRRRRGDHPSHPHHPPAGHRVLLSLSGGAPSSNSNFLSIPCWRRAAECGDPSARTRIELLVARAGN
jgi:hypothetical protein